MLIFVFAHLPPATSRIRVDNGGTAADTPLTQDEIDAPLTQEKTFDKDSHPKPFGIQICHRLTDSFLLPLPFTPFSKLTIMVLAHLPPATSRIRVDNGDTAADTRLTQDEIDAPLMQEKTFDKDSHPKPFGIQTCHRLTDPFLLPLPFTPFSKLTILVQPQKIQNDLIIAVLYFWLDP